MSMSDNRPANKKSVYKETRPWKINTYRDIDDETLK